MGYGYGYGCCYTAPAYTQNTCNTFILVVVLFILLIIVGTACL